MVTVKAHLNESILSTLVGPAMLANHFRPTSRNKLFKRTLRPTVLGDVRQIIFERASKYM